MWFEASIARRYLSAKNKPIFISLLTFISLLGMTISVFSLIFVLAIMRGFEKDFQKRVIGFKSPLVITGPVETDWPERAAELKNLGLPITEATPYVEGEAVLQTEAGSATAVRLRGVSGSLGAQRYGEVYFSESLDHRNIILGRELAYHLQLDPDFFEKIRMIFPFGEVGPTGEMLPVIRSYTVGGTFRSGFYEYDSKFVLLAFSEAARLLGDYARSGIEVWVEPLGALSTVKRRLEIKIQEWGGEEKGKFRLETWEEQNPKLFAALKLERIGMLLLLMVLLLIASCTIFGLISLTVIEKIKETAVLRSLGLSGSRTKRIFLLKAAAIGLIGDLLGGAMGLATVVMLTRHPLRLPSTYYVEYLPLSLDLEIVLGVLLLSPLLAILAAFYPSWQSATQSPTELLRYE